MMNILKKSQLSLISIYVVTVLMLPCTSFAGLKEDKQTKKVVVKAKRAQKSQPMQDEKASKSDSLQNLNKESNILSLKPNSIALVTGASGGIGIQVSKMLYNMGARVIISGRDEKKLNQLKGSLGDRCYVEVCDLNDLDSCANLIKKTEKKFGDLNILVCNGGGPIGTIDYKKVYGNSTKSFVELDKVVKVNLESTYVLNEKAIELMKSKGTEGRIINISAVSAILGSMGPGGNIDYSAAKAGVIALTKGFASAAGEYGIRVNAVTPGVIETNMALDLPPEAKLMITQMVSMKRLGKAEEVANAIIYLASEQASYITGTNLVVDGGFAK